MLFHGSIATTAAHPPVEAQPGARRLLEAALAASSDPAERERLLEHHKQLHAILAAVLLQVAHSADRQEIERTLANATSEDRSKAPMRLWRESSELLDSMVELPLLARAADDLVTFLARYVDEDPQVVLGRVRKLLPTARRSGLTGDRTGGARLLALCTHLMVRHPELMASDEASASVLDILDALVEAEWPEAQVLAAQLQDVWR